jgi:hypothetical protein
MKGLENNNDDIAINIKLKKEKINFGLCSAGLANDKGYILIQKYFITPKPV